MKKEELIAEAAGRLGDIDVLGLQISAICSMLHALYAAHPDPRRVRGHFERLLEELLDSPSIRSDPDRSLVLQATAAVLLRPPRSFAVGA